MASNQGSFQLNKGKLIPTTSGRYHLFIMEKSVFAVALALTINCTSAIANTAIECGKNVNLDDGTVGTRTFLLSSEDGKPMAAYNAANKKIAGAKITQGADGGLILTVVNQNGLGGPIGEKFVIKNPKGGNFTKAHHIMVGGFAGGSEVGTLDCVVSEM